MFLCLKRCQRIHQWLILYIFMREHRIIFTHIGYIWCWNDGVLREWIFEWRLWWKGSFERLNYQTGMRHSRTARPEFINQNQQKKNEKKRVFLYIIKQHMQRTILWLTGVYVEMQWKRTAFSAWMGCVFLYRFFYFGLTLGNEMRISTVFVTITWR